MKPLICFYENNTCIFSESYRLLSCAANQDPLQFLKDIEDGYGQNMKILKINFDAFNKSNLENGALFQTAPIDVFILNDYKILTLSELNSDPEIAPFADITFTPLIGEAEFIDHVKSIKNDIAVGRFYQMNFTSGLTAARPKNFSPLNYFKTLSQKIKCDYRALLPLDNGTIICLSPELFLKKSKDTVTTQPIKGTLLPGETLEDLQQSHKEDAELSMIVDLLRNDLNTLSCKKFKDSSRVNFHRRIMNLGYTSHTYSEVEIKTSKHLPEILQSTFPGGSISGCPKKESLLKISETENYNRDFYTGSIGWWQGNDFTLNLAIRSFAVSAENIFYFTGCGIVYDSDPEKEWREFLTKSSFLTLDLPPSN